MSIPLLLLLCSIVQAGSWQDKIYGNVNVFQEHYLLPNLPYQYNELEPYIDAKTLRVHHLGHHMAYTNKMNNILKEWRHEESSGLAGSSIVRILQNIESVPEKWRAAIRNNGGGYFNHLFYWATMCTGSKGPSEALVNDITRDFDSFEVFTNHFTTLATSLFGSGYVWLCQDEYGKLHITTTVNQDSPLSLGLYPILVLDVWEHSYYLQHQNKRVEYIEAWWNIVCWPEVDQLRTFWSTHYSNHSNHSTEHTEL